MSRSYRLRQHQRVFFAAYGFGPYECFFCRGEKGPVEFDVVHVHHINEDVSANHPFNLAPAHNACHIAYHTSRRRRGVPLSATHRAKIGAAHRGRRHTAEARAAIGAANRVRGLGRRPSAETRAKMSAAQRARWARQRNEKEVAA